MPLPKSLTLFAYCFLAFVIPFPFGVGAFSVMLVIAVFLFTNGWRTTFRNYLNRPALWIWAAFYGFHALSYFWSPDKDRAIFDLTLKLSLVLLPYFIGARGFLDERFFQKVMWSLVAGLCTVAVWCAFGALHQYGVTKDSKVFFYHSLVEGLDANAVYMAWYTFVALAFLLLRALPSPTAGGRWLYRGALALLSLFFVLLSARTMLLLFVFFLLPLALYKKWRQHAFSRLQAGIILTVIAVATICMLKLPNPVNKRFQELQESSPKSAFLPHYAGEESRFGNLAVRLFFWRVAFENIEAHHLWVKGAGVGGWNQLQNERMRQLGISNMEDNSPYQNPFYNANVHNTFLQTLLILGIGGLLLLLLMVMIMPLRHFFAAPSAFGGVFIGVSLFFMFQEAAFQTQAGIIFYVFMTSMLADLYYNRKVMPVRYSNV